MRLLLAATAVVACVGHASAWYSHALGLSYLNMARIAYCPRNAISDWSCNLCDTASNFQIYQSMYDPSTDNQGFVGYSPSLDEIVISFRGTVASSIKNWMEDINTGHMSGFPSSCSGCSVHEGFHNSYFSLRDEILQAVSALRQSHPGAGIAVTGHSLGAAMAGVCAADLLDRGESVSRLVTFGQPRTGNQAFYDFVSNRVGQTYRVTHHHDAVPHVPFEWMGFHHVSTEVYYSDDTTFKTCNGSGEDSSCADQWDAWDWSVDDHLKYLGLAIGSQAC
mmetsp:Transcript_18041/g.57713  ORF Transcript_18041/g.57713 Transcript_18041/m.57713 type:complete len:278 (-) Transcript_18041:231-1064(-)